MSSTIELPVLSKTQLAIKNETTIFLNNVTTIMGPPVKTTGLHVLKPSKQNIKLSGRSGKRITKGPKFFRGKHLYNLTLVERETCPDTCEQWSNCYGNHMPFAKRYTPGLELERALGSDLDTLDNKHPEGYIVRLHILGDFYSVGYVDFWREMLSMYTTMGIYGYTHRRYNTPIGDAVENLVKYHPERVSILRSDKLDINDTLPGAYTVPKGTEPRQGIVVCPQQTHEKVTCLSCGLCFNGHTQVQFLEH
jgi:hypothetical protein